MTFVLLSLPWAAVVGCLLALQFKSQERHDRQVADLCQRLQAPEVAVAQHVHDHTQAPAGLGYVPVDDDDAMRENVLELIGPDAVA